MVKIASVLLAVALGVSGLDTSWRVAVSPLDAAPSLTARSVAAPSLAAQAGTRICLGPARLVLARSGGPALVFGGEGCGQRRMTLFGVRAPGRVRIG